LLLGGLTILSPTTVSADDYDQILAGRWNTISGDDAVGALRADIEYSDPHVKDEAGATSGIELGYAWEDSARSITIGYQTDASNNATWYSRCIGCGLTDDQKFGNYGPVTKYRTRVGLSLKQTTCPDLSSCWYDIHYYVDGTRVGLQSVLLSLPRTQPDSAVAGGRVTPIDDETDMGVAGLLNITQMLNDWVDISAWVPTNTANLVDHWSGRYFTFYWTSGISGSESNLQVLSDCHFTSDCEYP